MTIILFLILAIATVPAHAGGGGGAMSSIVYDPTNHAENLVTAARSISAEAQRAQQIYNQVIQYRHQLMQAQGLNPTTAATLLTQNKQDMDRLGQYLGGLASLVENNNQLADLAKNRAIDIGYSGLSSAEYFKREQQRITQGDERRRQLAEHELEVMRSANADALWVTEIQKEIPGATAAQSAQIMNSQINKMVAQNSTLIQLQARNLAAQRQDAAARESDTADQERRVKGVAARRDAMFQEEINRLKQPTKR